MLKKIGMKLNSYIENSTEEYVKMHNMHWDEADGQFRPVHGYLETLYDIFSDMLWRC